MLKTSTAHFFILFYIFFEVCQRFGIWHPGLIFKKFHLKTKIYTRARPYSCSMLVTYHFHQVPIDQFLFPLRLGPCLLLPSISDHPDDLVTRGDPGDCLVSAVTRTGTGAVLPLVMSGLSPIWIPGRFSWNLRLSIICVKLWAKYFEPIRSMSRFSILLNLNIQIIKNIYHTVISFWRI